MAPSGAAPTEIDTDALAHEAEELAADTKHFRNRARDLHQRATALRDKLKEAGIGFVEKPSPTAREGEGEDT